MIGNDLQQFLLYQPAVTAYTTNIYLLDATENIQETYIRIYKIIPNNAPDSFGDRKFQEDDFQIDIFSLDDTVPEILGLIIVDLLNGFTGTIGSEVVAWSQADGPQVMTDTSDALWTHGIIIWKAQYRR